MRKWLNMDKTLQKILDIELSKGTHRLVCPYCAEVQSATDIDLQMCDDDKTCDRCGESFAYEREIVAVYYSKRK